MEHERIDPVPGPFNNDTPTRLVDERKVPEPADEDGDKEAHERPDDQRAPVEVRQEDEQIRQPNRMTVQSENGKSGSVKSVLPGDGTAMQIVQFERHDGEFEPDDGGQLGTQRVQKVCDLGSGPESVQASAKTLSFLLDGIGHDGWGGREDLRRVRQGGACHVTLGDVETTGVQLCSDSSRIRSGRLARTAGRALGYCCGGRSQSGGGGGRGRVSDGAGRFLFDPGRASRAAARSHGHGVVRRVLTGYLIVHTLVVLCECGIALQTRRD